MRLLVVDHDPTHRLALLRSLEQSSLDAEIVDAGTLADARVKLGDGRYDCVLIDQDLPDRDAIKLTTDIRGGGDPLPIIFVTGHDDEDATQQAIDCGVTDFLPKHDLSPRRIAFRIKFAIRVAKTEAETARLLGQATAAARARDDVLAIVSHDLRGPLHALSLATEALRDEAGNSNAARYLGAIERAGARAERLISDLLDATAVETGTLSLELARIDLAMVARQAAADHELLAQNAGGKVTATIPDGPVHVNADRDRMLQVLGNLIGNAFKHAPKTPVELAVERRDHRAVVSVTDHGPGIAPNELPHIFDRYWTGRTRHHGAGLGLAIAKGIVVAHGGTITVSSGLTKGARFEVELPLATRVT